MKKLILCISIILSLQISPRLNLANAQDEFVTCMGFGSPALAVSVHNSRTNKFIKTAKVEIFYIGSPEKIESAVFNNSRQVYFSYLHGSRDEPIGVVVSKEGYHTSVIRDLNFKVDTSCGAKNEWNLTFYLCPSDGSCL